MKKFVVEDILQVLAKEFPEVVEIIKPYFDSKYHYTSYHVKESIEKFDFDRDNKVFAMIVAYDVDKNEKFYGFERLRVYWLKDGQLQCRYPIEENCSFDGFHRTCSCYYDIEIISVNNKQIIVDLFVKDPKHKLEKYIRRITITRDKFGFDEIEERKISD